MNTVSPDGDNLIVTGWFSNSVQVIDPADGAILEDIRTLAVPTNAIRHGERLVAATIGTGNIVDATTGEEILGGLSVPLGLASDGQTLYVGDWATGIIHAVAPDGTSTVAVTGLTTPEGLAIFGDRLLVVEEALDRIVIVDPISGRIVPIIEGLNLGSRVIPGAVPYGIFN
ncbi:MAG TPA: hypothetical protein ENH15_04980, partial [Actinobacteria bacterium]|nr:hypothetical protein [Actinomycetota bacterium]